MKRHLVPKFATVHLTEYGIYMLISEDWVVIVRIADGMCGRIDAAELKAMGF